MPTANRRQRQTGVLRLSVGILNIGMKQTGVLRFNCWDEANRRFTSGFKANGVLRFKCWDWVQGQRQTGVLRLNYLDSEFNAFRGVLRFNYLNAANRRCKSGFNAKW
ncbi:hypothetical protein DPMN_005273 [Dreissena polymorpha]|uniref:Uncharacterized protein n=1 Tax=Dreissena polymorpha TaxID=45954 RepID=A0A9D4MRV7_DREPO|nr:hypothetical protein DPMN_005273 [Dreissena polymorpha]